MKKTLMSLAAGLTMIFTAQAQTIEELPINKMQNKPEFKITYPSGDVAYVDIHKLYPPKGTMTVGYVADFDPIKNEKFKDNAQKLAWNTGIAASAFKTHFASHAADLGISDAAAKALIPRIYKRSLQRLGL